MSKREYRRFTAEQKLEILREADQRGVTASEVSAPRAVAAGALPMAGGMLISTKAPKGPRS
jgi:hypothetical protein